MNQQLIPGGVTAAGMAGKLSYDVQALNQLRARSRTDEQGSIKAVAQQFESLFTSMMLRSMRAAVPDSGLTGSSETRMFQGMFDDQLAQNLSGLRGLGIARLVERQLSRGQAQPSGLPQDREASTLLPLRPAVSSATQAPVVKGAVEHSRDAVATPVADFVAGMIGQARQAAESLGVAPHLLAAQAALETGWGKRRITDAQGNDTHNVFGIKAGKGWDGPVAQVMTTEFEQGVAVRKAQSFRVYGSYREAFDDYARLLQGSQRYAQALNRGADARGFADALQNGGYATDPDYAGKLSRVAVSRTMQRAVNKAYGAGI